MNHPSRRSLLSLASLALLFLAGCGRPTGDSAEEPPTARSVVAGGEGQRGPKARHAAAGDSGSPVAGNTREQLEQVYLSYLAAKKNADTKELKRYASSATYGTFLNQALSMKISLEAYFKRASRYLKAPRDMSGWTHLVTNDGAEAVTLVYLSDKTKKLLAVTFVREDDGWKTHVVRSIPAGEIAGADELLAKNDCSFAKRAPFLPPEGILPAPAPVSEPDHVGYFNLISLGHKSTISINGRLCGTVSDRSLGGLIIGGLNAGANSVKLEVTAIDTTAKREFKLSIMARPSQGPQKTVFALEEPKSTDQEFVVDLTPSE